MTSVDPEDGMPWDFDNEAKREKTLDMVISNRALLLIGSPMCKALSKLMNWNWKRMGPKKSKKMKNEGVIHLNFCMMLYDIQMERVLLA